MFHVTFCWFFSSTITRFKVARAPNFAEKFEDIVGLYMSPP
jgi:hypothetical protein